MKIIFAAIIILLNLITMNASARDTIIEHSIKDALNNEVANEKLGNDIKFYFGEQAYSKPIKSCGEFKTNKKTNAFNKSDQEACKWVFLSAMISLRDRAMKLGANAVVNISSNYKNNLTSSNDTFQCGAGAFVAGVALVGTVVRLN